MNIDPKEADDAFKFCKKTVLDPYMKANGFFKYKSSGYVRLNPIGLVEYVYIQRMPHGCKTCTMDIALIPLYVPRDFPILGFGGRIGWLMGMGDFWWDHRDIPCASKSFQNMTEALDTFAKPWFKRYEDEAVYLQDVENGLYLPGYSAEEYAFYAHLKQSGRQVAHQFLESAYTLPMYEKSKRYNSPNAFENAISRLRQLLDSIDDPQAYLHSCLMQNIEKLKFPAAFKPK